MRGAMNRSQLHDLFDSKPGMEEITFEGQCHDCGVEVSVSVKMGACGFEVTNGAVYQPYLLDDRRFVKCRSCFDISNDLRNFQACEVYARCIGYLRPISQMNEGKRAEVKDRKMFSLVA